MTTSKIGVSNYNLTTTTSGAFAPVVYQVPSVQPPPFMITSASVSGIPGTPSPAPWPYGTSAPAPSGTQSSSTSGTPPLYIWWTADLTPVTTFPPQTVSVCVNPQQLIAPEPQRSGYVNGFLNRRSFRSMTTPRPSSHVGPGSSG